MVLRAMVLSVLLFSSCVVVASADSCIGEYQHCKSTGECTLFECDGPGPHCTAGQYRCPISNHCASNAADLANCPQLKGGHLDHNLPTEERVTKLIAATNLTEMIGQLTNAAPAIEHLGIPAYNWLSDDEHGVRGAHSTMFPDGPGLGATFDKDLLHAVGTVVGTEARAQHNLETHTTGMRDNAYNGDGITVYGPNMNLVKDPRWGRAQEVYSEDPRLSSALTVGYVTGIQGAAADGKQNNPKYMQAGACCKHYVAYDVEGNGPLPSRVYFDSQVDTRSFWEHYMPVFHSCIVEAKAMHAMCSYNSMNGVPTCADPNLLNGILRSQWGWDGFVVSDYDAYANIFGTHHYVKDMEHAAAAGINAGLDQEGGGTAAISKLQIAIDDGLTNVTVVENAFRRLMRMRIRLGMFDPPTLLKQYNALSKRDLQTKASTALNREAAGKGMVLLANNQGPLLPLKLSDYTAAAGKGSILVAGPTANNGNNTFGNYACDFGNCSTNVTSIFGGIQHAETGLDKGQVIYEPGCLTTNCSESDFTKVEGLARKAMVTVLVLGTLGWDKLSPGANPDPNSYEREGHDRTSIALAGNQYLLAEKLSMSNTGTPLTCVLIHGGSIKLGSLRTSCDAIVDAWFPGRQGGAAFADLLFGRINPAGRSPQTYYKDDDQLPKLGNMDLYAGNGTTYRYFNGTPDVPFGFGMSYTKFAYSNFVVVNKKDGHGGSGGVGVGASANPRTTVSVEPCDTVEVSVDVTNTGHLDGAEVVQLYVKTPHASVPAPRIRLADFSRVTIKKGATKTVTLYLTPKYHSVVHNEGRDGFWQPSIVVEAGLIQLSVGGGQPGFDTGVLQNNLVSISKSHPLTTQYKC